MYGMDFNSILFQEILSIGCASTGRSRFPEAGVGMLNEASILGIFCRVLKCGWGIGSKAISAMSSVRMQGPQPAEELKHCGFGANSFFKSSGTNLWKNWS